MALEGEDVRDYNLTEEQKAIKAKYPPVSRKYEYLDHTADVQLHAWGDTLEEAFEQCAMAMFGYMTDTGTVEPLQTIEVETQGDDLQSLLFHFLDEWLYKFSADEFFIPREVKVLNIDQRNFKIRSIGWGEEFSLSKHPQMPAAAAAASRFSRVRLCVTPYTAAHQAPPSLGFSRELKSKQ
ncbi:protein archease [Bos taurus]|uniref:Isoform 2 of tRNA-splicing ligase-activating factor archease n=1 Tax=Bos taurus TaxID=9913 RepID=Q2YDE7-2|nr:protein archease [Bos taurus]AAI10258.1 Zinc finger and BTB domain containing 8 opposite strand [Bos taurus]DAA32315.1 TPA: protein archease [Bos taurus]